MVLALYDYPQTHGRSAMNCMDCKKQYTKQNYKTAYWKGSEKAGRNRQQQKIITRGQTEQTNNYVAQRTSSLKGTYSDSYLQPDKYITD